MKLWTISPAMLIASEAIAPNTSRMNENSRLIINFDGEEHIICLMVILASCWLWSSSRCITFYGCGLCGALPYNFDS
jgi:uncharacterized protein (UPF0218 family)